MAFDLAKLKKLSADQLKAIDLSVEDVAEIEKGFMQEADYTRSKQEVAELKRIREANPDLDINAALDELNRWRAWRAQNADFEDRMRKADADAAELERLKAGSNGNNNGAARRRTERRYTKVTDPSTHLFETQRLYDQFSEVADFAVEEAVAAAEVSRNEWWDKTAAPRIQTVADDYLKTVGGPLRAMWKRVMVDDKGAPLVELGDVYKEMQVRGEGDFMKVANDLISKSTSSRTSTYEEGLKAGRAAYEEELRAKGVNVNGTAASPTPSGPSGRGTPTWTPPPAGERLTREQRFEKVISTVEKKQGRALPA